MPCRTPASHLPAHRLWYPITSFQYNPINGCTASCIALLRLTTTPTEPLSNPCRFSTPKFCQATRIYPAMVISPSSQSWIIAEIRGYARVSGSQPIFFVTTKMEHIIRVFELSCVESSMCCFSIFFATLES